MHDWLREDSRGRRLAVASGVYLVATAIYFTFASRATLTTHTPWNHYSLLAEAWLNGRLDLAGGPPSYAGMNDFAQYRDQWFVVFPPLPAVLLLPVVALAGSAERVQDGQFFLWLAGIAPAVLFLAFEKLRRLGVGGTGVAVGDGLGPQPLTARAKVMARDNGRSVLILLPPSLAWMFTVAFGMRRIHIG